MSIHQKVAGLLMLVSALWMASITAEDEKKPSGTVSISETQFGLILGGSTGEGTLTFKGEQYTFKIGGLSVGTVGVSKVSAAGEVYDLDDISQFPGTYTNLAANIALGGGVGGARLKNENGVIMRLESRTQGVQLKIGVDGLTVTMDK
jgi:hypothetical protein